MTVRTLGVGSWWTDDMPPDPGCDDWYTAARDCRSIDWYTAARDCRSIRAHGGWVVVDGAIPDLPRDRPLSPASFNGEVQAHRDFSVPLVFHEQVAAEIEERSQRKGRRRHRA